VTFSSLNWLTELSGLFAQIEAFSRHFVKTYAEVDRRTAVI